jgi:D-alanyl-D-alanine carboxypeptidase (penicillin-binding protein 5/6)
MKRNFFLALSFVITLFADAAGLAALGVPADTPELAAKAAVLMDAATGLILFEKNADEPIPPASLTKLMTINVAQKEAAARGVAFDEPMRLPSQSWAENQPPHSSLMFLGQGHVVTLHELFLGMAIPSGNDAAVAVALNFSPTTEAFARLMNREAAEIGMTNTVFKEPSGISEENLTTARDFAVFCREYLRRYPENLTKYHSVPQFTYPKPENLRLPAQIRGRSAPIVQVNHINLLYSFDGVDGLKTGFIDESGYNIALTAERDGTRFIAVILGVPASLGPGLGVRTRDADGTALLTWGFDNFKTIRPDFPPLPSAKVWKGKADKMPLDTPAGLRSFTVGAGRGTSGLRYEVEVADIAAPLPAGSSSGSITFYDDAGELARAELLTTADAEEGGFWKRLIDSVVMFFKGIKID